MGKNTKIIKELIKRVDWKYTLKVYLIYALSTGLATKIHLFLGMLLSTFWLFLWLIGKVNFIKLKKEDK